MIHATRSGGSFPNGTRARGLLPGLLLSPDGLAFFGGVMNLLRIAAITVFVLLEKVLSFGERGCRWMGALMVFADLLALVGLGWN